MYERRSTNQAMVTTRTCIRVFAPASAANLGPGFDVLGLALTRPGDIVEAEPFDGRDVEIADVSGDGGGLSRDPTVNVAGVAARAALRALVARGVARGAGVRLRLEKQMPLASGLGSSAASSAAGAMAVNELFGGTLSRRELVTCAMEGERAASGSAHADNVAPSLLGGIVLVRSYDPFEILSLPVPSALRVVVVRPHCDLPTRTARTLVSERKYAIQDAVANLGQLGAFVTALFHEDLKLLGRAISDRLAEPVRAALVPGFDAVKAAALSAGALGCSISGAGPSLFALCDADDRAADVAAAMQASFASEAALESDAYVGPVNETGAVVIG